ncbi:MAG: hypothetical protein BAA04_05960 [Firmicutes bacterium ZCTH02-B6]|nr:MAG: hypothetical protein BAA04_05960 [Firmicutes bacterium ZCTH02-B6]
MNRSEEIQQILEFIAEHPESYASLAVCRRALDVGLERVTAQTLSLLEEYLHQAPDDEIDAYYTIVS